MIRAPKTLEKYRVRQGYYATEPGQTWGSYVDVRLPSNQRCCIIACDGDENGWDHVSVSLKHRTPTWEEMDWVKRMFFEDNDAVFQFHVPVSQHINCHPNCLHLWRPTKVDFPLPPPEAV